MPDRLEGKVALITGAASGIGLAMARAMNAQGAKVALADIDDAGPAAAEIGDGAVALEVDVSAGDQVEAMFERTVAEFGCLDVLCNNAGIDGDLAPITECTPENFDSVMAVNLRGVYLGMHHGIPAMLASGGGSIINIASIAGQVAFPTGSAYCASKAGVLALTRTAAVEFATEGVRVNAICPGIVRTPMAKQVSEDAPFFTAALQMTPAARLGEPEEIAATAVFLASDEAPFLTGGAVTVDGGYSSL